MFAFLDRVYTVRTKTHADQAADTDDNIYLTMYDVEGNACVTRRLDNGQDVFESDA